MGFGNCACPLPAAIVDIPAFSCGEDFGQIQKIIIQRRQSAPSFATVVAAGTLANWTALLAAVNATKVQVTPFVENVVIPQGTPITEGGDDNTTIDGAVLVVGAATIQLTGNFRSLSKDIVMALKAYNCESDLTVFFVNQFGKIIGGSPDGVQVTGIPITSFFVGDGGAEGLNTNDKNGIQFNLRYGWRDNVMFVTPVDFDARFDL